MSSILGCLLLFAPLRDELASSGDMLLPQVRNRSPTPYAAGGPAGRPPGGAHAIRGMRHRPRHAGRTLASGSRSRRSWSWPKGDCGFGGQPVGRSASAARRRGSWDTAGRVIMRGPRWRARARWRTHGTRWLCVRARTCRAWRRIQSREVTRGWDDRCSRPVEGRAWSEFVTRSWSDAHRGASRLPRKLSRSRRARSCSCPAGMQAAAARAATDRAPRHRAVPQPDKCAPRPDD